MTARPIPEATKQAQLAVSNPAASAWVSANAGSGKTYVLSQRVIRLLLRGTPPGKILCLTFTKAAAAHMANQVLKTLRGWVSLDDPALDAELARIEGGKPTAARRDRARRLFATALETPGGLKVQTIHAFCDRVLHQFPFEANVPAGFTVLEETNGEDLLRRAQDDVLLEAARLPESELGRALAHVVATATDTSLAGVFGEVVRTRRKLSYLLEAAGLARADEAICAGLGLARGDTLAAAEAQILHGEFLPRSEWKSVASTLTALTGNAARRGAQLLKAAEEDDGAQAIETYLSVFLTEKGTPREIGGFGDKKTRDKESAVQRLVAECARIVPLLDRRRALQTLERTRALNALGRAMIARYEAMKAARGALDYDDLVGRTAALLRDQAAAWVHYKLDGGIEHILIDEAQDTSPEQWEVVGRLAQEFFAGEGASERRRTIFAVGDEKQSIFGFQGADPKSFDEMRRAFQRSIEGAKLPFEPRQLDLSFRSAAGIVQAVDQVFGAPENFRGLSSSAAETSTAHTAIRNDAPALVEVWETVQSPEGREDELAWDAPLDSQSAASTPVMLAQRIAKAINRWLRQPDFLIGDPATEKPRRPHEGDIIVLVRSRGPLFEAILRELKRAGIAVAGADRLKLSEHIAVMDICALCDALLLPADDLALACALKSPLFGLNEEELFGIAHGREGTLRAALETAAGRNARFATASETLDRWQAEARSLRPFDFFSRLLGRDGGRERMLGRFGPEAADALDELLAHALSYEAAETPSLAGFLVYLRRSGSQVKRDLEIESHAVRVMTVHGVKGLEAPIVVLADTTSPPDSKRHHPKLLPLAGMSPPAFVWAAGEDCAAVERARAAIVDANEGEHRRLLYVALTRARDALVVCGAAPRQRELPPGCWYGLVRDALAKDERFAEVATHGYGFDEKVFRWRHEPQAVTESPAPPPAREMAEPAWLRTALPGAANAPAIATAAAHRSAGRGEADAARAEARRRGILIHRLLQELPRFEAAGFETRAARFLDHAAADLSAETRKAIAREAIALLRRTELAELFGPQSRAEVSISGRWDENGEPYEDFGRVDRLAVTENEVLIADFKSDAAPPASAENTPEVYIRQLARYRAILARLYPQRAMRAFVVWSATGAIHEVPKPLLDKAFTRITA